MIRLRIGELARQRGISLSLLQRTANLPMTTARRYWHSSATGMAKDAGTLREVNLLTIEAIANILQIEPGELLTKN